VDESCTANDQDEDVSEYLIEHWWRKVELLADEVGDVDLLVRLAVITLPDEPFDSSAVDPRDTDRVAALVDLCDEACDALFETEQRTSCRRLLARVARTNPDLISARRDQRRLAAAVVYAVARANRSVGPGRSVLARDVLRHFGVTGRVSDLAAALIHSAVPGEGEKPDPTHRGSAELLTRAGRERIIAERDEALVWVRAVATDLTLSS